MAFEKVEALGLGQRTERANWGVVETVHAGAPSGRGRRSCAPAKLARPLCPTLSSWPRSEYGTWAPVELTLVLTHWPFCDHTGEREFGEWARVAIPYRAAEEKDV